MDGFTGDLNEQLTSAPATDDGKRARKRDSMFLSAQLRISAEQAVSEVRIRNLSAGGLMAEIGRVVPIGTPVEMEIRGIGAITGRVAWCAERRIGIALDEPIDPRQARVPVGGGTRTPLYAKPALDG